MAERDPFGEDLHEDQLVPVAVPYHNRIMHGPPGTDVMDVSTYVGPDASGQHAITALAYTLDDRQRAMIAAGAHVTLNIWQAPMPPVSLAIEGPFCDLHQSEKLWRPDEVSSGWVCELCQGANGSSDDDGSSDAPGTT